MKLYNTLTKKIEGLKPINDKRVNMFVCGPTVYDYSHIGHAKTYTQLDLLARVLRQSGYEVYYLQNITNIDDKIIKRAQETGEDWKKLVSKYQEEYQRDMKTLGNSSVDEYAPATDYIDNIIAQVKILLAKDFAYKTDDGIYFEIAKFPDYGKLSGRTKVKENDAETRIDQSDSKRGWNDFCIWKFSKPGEPIWDAEFGRGRPGWHIEDTAITEHFFGPQYDVHGGAVDLIFPHHEAEITLMESASGKKPFVRHWVHTNFLNIDKQKMSKSLGNFFTIKDVLKKGYDPMALRLLMLQSHYRSSINFSWDSLDAATEKLASYRKFADLRQQLNPMLETLSSSDYKSDRLNNAKSDMLDALHNDLATPKALAVLDQLSSQLLLNIDEDRGDFDNFIIFLDEVFGLDLYKRDNIPESSAKLIEARNVARKKNNFLEADAIRNKLKTKGIGVEDIGQENRSIWYRV